MIDLAPGWLPRQGTEGALLALLLLGHVLADFVAQTESMVARKGTRRGLLDHGRAVLVIHVAVLLPYLSPATLLVLFALTGLHLLVDAAKVRLRPRTHLQASLFLADQAAHALLLLGTWWLIVANGWWSPRDLPVGPTHLSRIAVLAAAFAFAWNGGSAIVRDILGSREAAAAGSPNRMGKLIGCLERWIVITLVLVSQWAAIAFVFTAKSIARFKQIEERNFAEYYLVGTLSSLVVAIGTGLAAAWMLGL